jgi:hypothetical protein
VRWLKSGLRQGKEGKRGEGDLGGVHVEERYRRWEGAGMIVGGRRARVGSVCMQPAPNRGEAGADRWAHATVPGGGDLNLI